MNRRFVFVGNRRFVLERMVAEGVRPSAVLVVAGTHLERDLQSGKVPGIVDYTLVHNKAQLLAVLRDIDYDILVANGCPYILPIGEMPPARYVNIHPSCLPDLRGVDPVIGAILFARDGGATCHVMDAGIDTGPIVAQVRIPFTEDLDVSTLYQLSFAAEQRVFSAALALGFQPQYEQAMVADTIYYSRSLGDRTLTFREPNELMLRRIRAFGNRSQGCLFTVGGQTYRVFSAQKMQNPFLVGVFDGMPDCTVGLSYEGGIVFKKDGEILRFVDMLAPDGGTLPVGTRLLADDDVSLQP